MSEKYPYDYYVNMVEQRYFGNVDRKVLPPILECFTADAVFTIQSEPRTHTGRDSGIKRMFERLLENYTVILHKDFRHVVDVANESIASQFRVELEAQDGARTYLTNCNFFYLTDGKFNRVFVYMSGENVLV